MGVAVRELGGERLHDRGVSRAAARPLPRFHVLAVSAAATLVVAVLVFADAGGWEYYRAAVAARSALPAHRLLRPSGVLGQGLGVAGFAMMLVPLAYAARKRLGPASRLGRLDRWLAVHIFSGIMGPVLITFHTAFKFNGLISVAYWSMVLVVLSGFVGRYLYVRIPKSIRGAELTCQQIEARAAGLRDQLQQAAGPALSTALAAYETARVPPAGARWSWRALAGGLRRRLLARRLRRALAAAGLDRGTLDALVTLAVERATLLRRLAYLQTTRRMFALWHVFHQPLVYLMFAIAALHVAVAVYLGYTFW